MPLQFLAMVEREEEEKEQQEEENVKLEEEERKMSPPIVQLLDPPLVFMIFKTLCGDDVCMCPFPLHFQCIFQVPVDDEQSGGEDEQRTL